METIPRTYTGDSHSIDHFKVSYDLFLLHLVRSILSFFLPTCQATNESFMAITLSARKENIDWLLSFIDKIN